MCVLANGWDDETYLLIIPGVGRVCEGLSSWAVKRKLAVLRVVLVGDLMMSLVIAY